MSTTIDVGLQCPLDLPSASESTRLAPVIEKYETALLMLAGFAGFSLLIGLGYNALRYHVFREFNNLDVVFDAGGRVSVSLTAVTVTSQLLWPADFLQSPTIASKVGIGGSLWYTLAIVLSVLVFPVLCIQLKTRAPGAKTFPQIAYARFGKATHILFCCIALFTNLVIIANLILAGKVAIDVLTKDTSNEFIVMILAVLFGSYCLVGGLGTTFYISYFNTALIFISTSLFILKITYLAEPEVEKETSAETLYNSLSCLKGPDGNYQNSLLTFRTESGIIYGVVTLFMTTAIIFCDQANWQSRIAAKPKEGMIGFIIAGFLWFAIPTSISFVSSMTYKSLSFKNGTNLLTDTEIDEGFISPFIIQTLLGKEGCFLLLTMLTMTLMSTGSGEVMSVSSILVYDIIKTYVRPFRRNLKSTDCPICGNSRLFLNDDADADDDGSVQLCECPSAADCEACRQDIAHGLLGKLDYGFQYTCTVHGKYRHYEDVLLQQKTWCMLWVVICIVPIGLIIIESGMNLNWTFLAAQIFIAPFQVPLFLTIAWAGATSKGMLSGGIVGLIAAITGMFSYASTYQGGLSNFYVNTTNDWSLMTGLLSGVTSSTVLCIGVSLCTKPKQKHSHQNFESVKQENGNLNIISSLNNFDVTARGSITSRRTKRHLPRVNDLEIEWQKTMSIDSPLNPYRELYKEELQMMDAGKVLTSRHMETLFKSARWISYISAGISLVVFLIIVPVLALTQEVLTVEQLETWIFVCQHWCLVGTVFVVIVPPVQEGIQIWRQHKINKRHLDNKTDNKSERDLSLNL